jgi:hypothetical protein
VEVSLNEGGVIVELGKQVESAYFVRVKVVVEAKADDETMDVIKRRSWMKMREEDDDEKV